MKTSKRTLTWLHLSDLHARKRDNWDQKPVTDKLIEDLKVMGKKLHPDFIFFTGDAAFASKPEEYASARGFFDGVRKAFEPEIPVSRFYIVPGNHDVDRDKTGTDTTEWFHKNGRSLENDIIPKLRDNSFEFQNWMQRLHSYREFVKDYCPHLQPDDPHLMWTDVQKVHGVSVGVCGLNTSWSCVGDEDERGLWMGTVWQIAHAKQKFAHPPDFTFALLHHPTHWLNKNELPKATEKLGRAFEVVLHGHEHWVGDKKNNDDHVVISAGACYQSSSMANGYNFGEIDLDTGLVQLHLREWDEHGEGWIEQNIAQRTNHGVLNLGKLKWAAKPYPKKPSAKAGSKKTAAPVPNKPTPKPADPQIFKPIEEAFARILENAPNLAKTLNDDRKLGTDGSRIEVAKALVPYFTEQLFHEAVINLEKVYGKLSGPDRAAMEGIFDCMFYLALAPETASTLAEQSRGGPVPVPRHAPHGVLHIIKNWMNKNHSAPIRSWTGEKHPELCGDETPQQTVARLTDLMKQIRGITLGDATDSTLEAQIATENLRDKRKVAIVDDMSQELRIQLDQSPLKFAAILIRAEGITINQAQLAKLQVNGYPKTDFEAFVEEGIRVIQEIISTSAL